MGIKNWTVTTQQIKNGVDGLESHANYLLEASHKNHANTEKIIELHGSPLNIENEYWERRKERKERGIGGGAVKNLATSFVLSLPPEIKPTAEEWRAIYKDVVEELAELIDVDKRTLAASSYAVLHDEADGKPSHIHALFSNIVDGKTVKKLTQKSATFQVKNTFNKSVKKHLKISNNQYQKKTINNKPQKKKKPVWAARVEKAKDAEKRAEAAEKRVAESEKRVAESEKRVANVAEDVNDLKHFGQRLIEWINKKIRQIPAEKERIAAAKQGAKVAAKSIRYEDLIEKEIKKADEQLKTTELSDEYKRQRKAKIRP